MWRRLRPMAAVDEVLTEDVAVAVEVAAAEEEVMLHRGLSKEAIEAVAAVEDVEEAEAVEEVKAVGLMMLMSRTLSELTHRMNGTDYRRMSDSRFRIYAVEIIQWELTRSRAKTGKRHQSPQLMWATQVGSPWQQE